MRLVSRLAPPAAIAALAAAALSIPAGSASALPPGQSHCQKLAKAVEKNMEAAGHMALTGNWSWFDHFTAQAHDAATAYALSGC
jgi:hypothetical protein